MNIEIENFSDISIEEFKQEVYLLYQGYSEKITYRSIHFSGSRTARNRLIKLFKEELKKQTELKKDMLLDEFIIKYTKIYLTDIGNITIDYDSILDGNKAILRILK